MVTVTQAYYGLVVAQRKYSTSQRAAAEAAHFLDISQKLENGGEVAHADVADLGFELGDQMVIQLFYLVGDEAKAEEQNRTMGVALARYASLDRSTAVWRERYLQVVTEALRAD